MFIYVWSCPCLSSGSLSLVWSSEPEKRQCGCVLLFSVGLQAIAGTMALSYKKDLDKYKDLDEDEILNKLSAEELKQLETALEEMDPEVRAR